jgi:hypothetical protein
MMKRWYACLLLFNEKGFEFPDPEHVLSANS